MGTDPLFLLAVLHWLGCRRRSPFSGRFAASGLRVSPPNKKYPLSSSFVFLIGLHRPHSSLSLLLYTTTAPSLKKFLFLSLTYRFLKLRHYHLQGDTGTMEDAESSTAATPGFPLSRWTANKLIRDRISRALEQRLILLHRSSTSPYSATFFVLGAIGNVYTVTISTTPSCTCPDPVSPCKHILFVLLRVLGLPPSDCRLRRRTLSHADVFRALLATDTDTAIIAGPNLLSRFRQIFSPGDAVPCDPSTQGGVEDRAEESEEEVCPVCLEKMERRREPVAVCVSCRNAVHVACFERWKKSRERRGVTCVMCRARWKTRNPEDKKYVNLEPFVEGVP